MGVAVDGFCHDTLQAAATWANSRAGLVVVGDAPLLSVGVDGSQLEYTYAPVSGSPFSLLITPSPCDDAGPLTGAFGLSIADAGALAALIVGVWVAAWAVSVLRRGLMA